MSYFAQCIKRLHGILPGSRFGADSQHLQHRTGIDYVEIGMAKLVFILENFGKSSFAKPGIHRRLRAVLDGMEGDPHRTNHVRFERTFRALVDCEASAWDASPFVPSSAATKANM